MIPGPTDHARHRREAISTAISSIQTNQQQAEIGNLLRFGSAEHVGEVCQRGPRLVKGSPMPSTTPAVTLRLPDATKHPLP